MSGAQQQNEQFPYVFFVPYSTAKFTLGFSTTLTLLLLAIIRILNISRIPAKSFESLFFLFSTIFLSAVILFTEAAEQYDLFLAIPLAINAGVVLSTLFCSTSERNSLTSNHNNHSGMKTRKRLAAGLFSLTLILASYHGLASYVSNRPSLTFARISSDVTLLGPGSYQTSPTRLAIRFSAQHLAENTTISGEASINPRHLQNDNPVRFLISLDQRHENATWASNHPSYANIECTVRLNDKQAFKGKIADLSTPIFVTMSPTSRDEIKLKLQMKTTAPTTSTFKSPTLAVEYIH